MVTEVAIGSGPLAIAIAVAGLEPSGVLRGTIFRAAPVRDAMQGRTRDSVHGPEFGGREETIRPPGFGGAYLI
jgi:hypothetical protein